MKIGPVDPASVAHLSGIFAPIQDEIDVGPLEVVQGSLPRELTGVYLRNGPNCRFPPLGSYTYPLDGDGMLHAIELADGRARYRNRFVRTPGLAAEERAGRALWGGVLTPVLPSKEEVGPELAEQFKDLPDVNIIRHAGQYLALAESARPFRVTRDLATLGPWNFAGGLPDGICAHPKIDPVTGELVVFRYGFAAPYLTWAIVGPNGEVSQPQQAIDLDRPFMIHDFAVTEHYIILFVCPAVFEVTDAAATLQWRPELGTRIALVPRRGSPDDVRWVDAEPFWVWHFANAFETRITDDSIRIVVDFPRWSRPGFDRTAPASCGVVRAEIDPAHGSIQIDQRDDRMAEFPRIDDRRSGRTHRWYYVASKEHAGQALPQGEWNELCRYDMQTGTVTSRKMGSLRLGEPVFAPTGPDAAEDQGYVVTFATDVATLESYFLVLHAADIAGEPAATLRMPHRVPFGLHGCWVPGK